MCDKKRKTRDDEMGGPPRKSNQGGNKRAKIQDRTKRTFLSFNAAKKLGEKTHEGRLLDFMVENNVDVAFVQEAGQKAFGVDNSTGKKTIEHGSASFQVLVRKENPPVDDTTFDGELAYKSENESSYAIISRADDAKLQVGEPSMPKYGGRPSIQKYLQVQKFGKEVSASTSKSGRPQRPSVRGDARKYLGLRRPLKVPVTIDSKNYTFYNYHAPQGGGANKNGSGMDARFGHDLFRRYLNDTFARFPNKTVFVGDMNLDNTGISEAWLGWAKHRGTEDERLSHVVYSDDLNVNVVRPAGTIQLSSDHNPLLFEMQSSGASDHHTESKEGEREGADSDSEDGDDA